MKSSLLSVNIHHVNGYSDIPLLSWKSDIAEKSFRAIKFQPFKLVSPKTEVALQSFLTWINERFWQFLHKVSRKNWVYKQLSYSFTSGTYSLK